MTDDVQHPNDTILHQDAVEDVISDVIEGSVGIDHAAIPNASVAHALNATFSDTEVEGALNTLGGKINSILTVLRDAGMIAP